MSKKESLGQDSLALGSQSMIFIRFAGLATVRLSSSSSINTATVSPALHFAPARCWAFTTIMCPSPIFISELRKGNPLIVPLTGTRPLRSKTATTSNGGLSAADLGLCLT